MDYPLRSFIAMAAGYGATAAVAWVVGAAFFDIRRPALVMLLWSTCNGAITGWVLARFIRSWLREFDREPDVA